MIGIYWNGSSKAGDRLSRTSLPENYYKNTGEKLINFDCMDFFKCNPYIIDSKEIHPNTLSRVIKRGIWGFSIGNVDTSNAKTMAHELCINWGLPKCYKTSPDLYIYKNSRIYSKNLVINTTGLVKGAIPLYVLNHIREVYSDYLIWQIGGIQDMDANCDIDRRGCHWLESAKLMSECEMFIGVDSFCYWLAKCYKIRKKIILAGESKERCEHFFPRGFVSELNPFDNWLECDGTEFYNTFEEDLGITKSYLNI